MARLDSLVEDDGSGEGGELIEINKALRLELDKMQ